MKYLLTRMFGDFLVQYIENGFHRLDIVHIREQSFSERPHLFHKWFIFRNRASMIPQNFVVRLPIVLARRAIAIEKIILQYFLLSLEPVHMRVYTAVACEYLISGMYRRQDARDHCKPFEMPKSVWCARVIVQAMSHIQT